MASVKNLLSKIGLSERRGNTRYPAGVVDASWGDGPEKKRLKIKDISSTGMYVLTENRWQPGTSIQMILQAGPQTGTDSPLQVRLWTRSVRFGEDGVGLIFEQKPVNGHAWENMVRKAAQLLGKTNPVRMFRTTRELAFLLHISPSAEQQILEVLRNKLNRESAERAVEIVLGAEDLLTSQNCAIRSDVSPTLILQILENAPKSGEEQTRQMWTQLLATSCMAGTDDMESMKFALLLSEIDELELRVFNAACARAMSAGWEPGFRFRRNLHCSVDETRQISHIQNLVSIERIMHHMHGLEVLEKTDRPRVFAPIEDVNLTPTVLGLKLYARCKGQMELPESLESTELQRAC